LEAELVHDVAARTWMRSSAPAPRRAAHAEAALDVALEASTGGSWTWVAATNQVDWDERFRALYGFAPHDPATPDAWIPRVTTTTGRR